MDNKIIAGNWKMNHDPTDSFNLLDEITNGLKDRADHKNLIIFPPFIYLHAFNRYLTESKSILQLGAQNIHFEENGAYTGEISASMIKSTCKYVIIAHSERRQYFNETNETISKKIQVAMSQQIIPIFCVGEKLEDRESSKTFQTLEHQILPVISQINNITSQNIIIAYEPVWAIGTGLSATKEQISEVHLFIKDLLNKHFNIKPSILYGGSCNPSNAKEILTTPNVGGALIGGASLKSSDFLNIIDTAYNL